jgi:hypothetical protein
VAYSVNTTTMALSTLAVQAFNATSPVVFHPCGETDFQLWHTAPVFSNGWALLGELAKYVPVAPARVRSISVAGTDTSVSLDGQAGESVALTFWNTATATATTVPCTLGGDGTAVVVIPYGLCQTL